MNKEPEIQELQKQFAVLEGRMKPHESRIDSTLNAMRTDIERINTDAAKRNDADNTKWDYQIKIYSDTQICGNPFH